MQLGRGHTKGDTVVWLPQEQVLFSGDLVEYRRHAVHRRRLPRATGRRRSTRSRRCEPEKLVPGRGARADARPPKCKAGLDGTRAFVTAMFDAVKRGVAGRQGSAHRLPGHVRRAEAEVRPLGDLRPLPAVRRDARLRRSDAAIAIRASGPPSATRRCGERSKAEAVRGIRPADGEWATHVQTRRTRSAASAGPRRRAARRVPGRRSSAPARSGSPRRSTSRSAASPVVVLDDDDTVSVGSRAICYAKRTLEILDRLGCGAAHGGQGRAVERRQGLLPRRARSIASTCCPSRASTARPSSTCSNTTSRNASSQRARDAAGVELRWQQQGRRRRSTRRRRARCDVETPDGAYALDADWLLACDGARSPVRQHAGPATSQGQVFRDRFLIADVQHEAAASRPSAGSGSTRRSIPASRCCCIGRPTTSGASTSSSAGTPTPSREAQPERIMPRRRARCSAPDAPFELEWASVYTFRCRRMEHFRHGRVLFAGDAAHRVSPVRRARRQLRRAGRRQPRRGSCALRAARRGARARCSTATTPSACSPPTRTSCNSTRATDFITPKSECQPRCSATRCWSSRSDHAVRAAAGQQRPAVGAGGARAIRRSTRRIATRRVRAARCVPGRAGRRCAGRRAARVAGCSITSAATFTLLAFGAVRSTRDGAARSHAVASAVPQSCRSAAHDRRRRRSQCRRRRGPRRAALRRRGRARAISSGPTSTSARAGARSMLAAVRAAHRPRDVQSLMRSRWPRSTPTPTSPRPTISTSALIAMHRGLTDEQSALVQREADPAARQPHRRRRGARGGDGGRARGHRDAGALIPTSAP